MNNEAVRKYAEWVVEQCISPTDEVVYLLNVLLSSDKANDIVSIIESVLEENEL